MEEIYANALEMGVFTPCVNFGEAAQKWLDLLEDLRTDDGQTGRGWERNAAHFFADRFFRETMVH